MKTTLTTQLCATLGVFECNPLQIDPVMPKSCCFLWPYYICWEPLISRLSKTNIAIVKLYIVYTVMVVFSQQVVKMIGACFDIFTASVRYDAHFFSRASWESSRPSLLSYSRLSYRTQTVIALLKAEPAVTADAFGGSLWQRRSEIGFTQG